MFDLTPDQIRAALSHIPAHDREVWVKIGNALKTELGAEGFSLFDDWSQTADSYKANDAKSVWKSLQVGKNHLGTIIHHAKQNGFDPAQIGEIKTLSPQEQAERSTRLKAKQEQAAREELEAAQAFIPLVADILKQCIIPTLPPPYAQTKSIGTHNLLTIEAATLQRFKAPDTKKIIGLCLAGALTVAPLETLDGELVALQVFDGAPDDKGKFARRYVNKPSVVAGYYRLGDWTAPTVIVITEGMADAVSCFEASGYPVLAAGSVGRLEQAAQAVKAKHPGALVAVVGDNDSHGKGQETARSAAAAVAGVCVIPDGEGVKDANDLLRSNGQEAVKIMIDAAIDNKKAAPPSEEDAAPETQTSGDSVAGGEHGGDIPKGHLAAPMPYAGGQFDVLSSGLFFVDEDKEGNTRRQFVSSPIVVKAMTRTGTGRAWGRLLEWRDPDSKLHQWAMPLELLQGDGSDVRRELSDRGMQINPGKRSRDLLTLYLQLYPVTARALCVERLGWHGNVYVMPGRTSGNSDELTVFQNPHGIEAAFSQSGTVTQWRDSVACLAIGNSRMLFSVSTAFAAPLAELVNEDSGGAHLRDGSSSGKSTCLEAAASVYGKPKAYKREWRATTNGLEGLAALHNDSLLVLDELNQCDPKAIGQAVYMLANGQSKARMSKALTTRPALTWRLLFLSAGEQSLADLMKQAGHQTHAGQEIRLADIPADAGAGLGAFEVLHGAADASAFAVQIKDAATTTYGSVGLQWLDHIASNKPAIAAAVARHIAAFTADHVPAGASGQVQRVARRFGLIAAGGELASEAVLTGWPAGAASAGVGRCFADWLAAFGGIGNLEERTILAHVKAFFEAHGSSRFEAFDQIGDKIERIPNRAGYWKQNGDGKRYLVFPEQFKNEVCKGYDYRHVSKVLAEVGVLIKGSGDKPTRMERIPDNADPVRMYAINANILFSEGYKGYKGYTADSKGEKPVAQTKNGRATKATNQENAQDYTATDDDIDSVAQSCSPCSPTDSAQGYKETHNKINDVAHVADVAHKKRPIVAETTFVEGEV